MSMVSCADPNSEIVMLQFLGSIQKARSNDILDYILYAVIEYGWEIGAIL